WGGGGTQGPRPASFHRHSAVQALRGRRALRVAAVKQLAAPAAQGREMLLWEARRPAATTDRWQTRFKGVDFAAAADKAMAGISVIETANAEEEALAIAVCLREGIEVPHQTAALVTPDRDLARRVVAAPERWPVEVEGSGGDALTDTPPGIF